MNKKNIALAITGASGAIYAKLLMEKLTELDSQVGKRIMVLSSNAKEIWKSELNDESYLNYGFSNFAADNFNCPIASGSNDFDVMIICPCSMGTLGRIANGISNDLITRAADVFLKERKKLILVAREAPYSLIHLRNMTTITEAGGIICPASPSFYSNPKDINELAMTIIDRVIDLAGFENKAFRWKD